jgi:hypothetical protein
LRQRTHARAHALVGWLSGRLDSSVRPCGRARGVAGVGVVYQRLRESIVEARVMDPTFSILPLGGNGGEMITKPEEWPNTKEGIDKYYSHWSRQHNVAGKMKIVTALSMMQLKNQSGTFLTHLKRKGVHINCAQLGMVETVTLGWIGQAHPSFGCRDETKEKVSKLMKSEYPNMQYALFARAFNYVTDKNVKMTT